MKTPVQVERREEEELGATERQWVTLSPAEPVSTQEQGVPGGADEAVIPADPRVYAQADPQRGTKGQGSEFRVPCPQLPSNWWKRFI